MAVQPFLLVVVDEDKKHFAIKGPMTDDRPWINRVCAAQASGRQVRCFTSGHSNASTAAEAVKAQFGYDEAVIDLPAA